MNQNNLDVFINKEPSGKLSFEDEKYIFNYHDNSKDVISLTMPIRKESWVSGKLHPVFDMNMPEGALKEAIKHRFSKIHKMNDMGFLKLIGPYMLGRVKFEKVVCDEDKLSLDSILSSSEENLFEELMDKFAIRSGVSGVQPKLLLSAQNKNTMKFEHFIVKSWTEEYPQLALNEYFCMRAIKNANLPTPDFYISDDLKMFVMKRFDVNEDQSYKGFEDMCVLSARNSDEKYDASYEEVVRILKDVLSIENKKEGIKTFFTAIIMNHLLKNGDGHLKNYGVLYNNDFHDAKLAPIYDVITTTVYIKKDIPALKLSNARLWFKEKTYIKFAKASCNISNKEYKEIIDTCINAIKITKNEIDAFGKLHNDCKDFLYDLKDNWLEDIK